MTESTLTACWECLGRGVYVYWDYVNVDQDDPCVCCGGTGDHGQDESPPCAVEGIEDVH